MMVAEETRTTSTVRKVFGRLLAFLLILIAVMDPTVGVFWLAVWNFVRVVQD